MHLHLVTDRNLTLGRSLIDIVRAAAAGGVSVVQLREKDCSTRDFVELGRAVCAELNKLNIPLIINDRIDVALAVGADGVHIGQSDMPYTMARELMGPDALIGLSVETPEQAAAAQHLDVDYLGLSPVFSTTTKADIAPPLGLAGVRRIRTESRHRLIAIGGINQDNAIDVINAGADGLAVVSAICSAKDPQTAAANLNYGIVSHKRNL